MATRNIVKIGDPVLRKTSREVKVFDKRLHVLLDDMLETMRKADGVGLAAPQVGILKRVVVIEIGDLILEMVNPEIVAREGEQTGAEGCLSIPMQQGEVTRPMKVKVVYQDRNGDSYELEGEELLARAICHELDHLDGHLYTDFATRTWTYDPAKNEGQE
ncbi:MAG: peptide deformylase [Clostridia bacterium]|nr:peptide deformylase [Clostridia bacterium]